MLKINGFGEGENFGLYFEMSKYSYIICIFILIYVIVSYSMFNRFLCLEIKPSTTYFFNKTIQKV